MRKPDAAGVFASRDQCRKIAKAPEVYLPRPELGTGLRSCAYGNYLIVFVEDAGVLQIVRVLHGAMDIEAQFDNKNAPQ